MKYIGRLDLFESGLNKQERYIYLSLMNIINDMGYDQFKIFGNFLHNEPLTVTFDEDILTSFPIAQVGKSPFQFLFGEEVYLVRDRTDIDEAQRDKISLKDISDWSQINAFVNDLSGKE